MSENLPKQSASEEVDLGQLFNLIGNTFQKLFNFIASIFKGLYHVVLVLLIHVYNRIKWYAAAAFLGLALGFVLDTTSDDVYGANSIIETNFSSAHQVYENLKYLNQLADVEEDSVELARKLSISVKDAASIKGIYIDPDIDEHDRIKMFVEYKKGLDSFSFQRHKIGVESTNRFIFPKLNENFIEALLDNTYLKELKDVELRNFKSEQEFIDNRKKEIDSLAIEYLKIRKIESEKEPIPGTGTNLYMGNSEQRNLLVNESELLANKMVLEAKKREINVSLVKNDRVVNVISQFPDAGYDVSEWTDKFMIILPALFFLITFFGFVFYGLGKYLSEQDKKLKQQ